MPDKKGRAEDADRFVIVSLPRETLRDLERRRDAFNAPTTFEAPPGHRRTSGLRVTVDAVATRLLVWALEHAPEPLP